MSQRMGRAGMCAEDASLWPLILRWMSDSAIQTKPEELVVSKVYARASTRLFEPTREVISEKLGSYRLSRQPQTYCTTFIDEDGHILEGQDKFAL